MNTGLTMVTRRRTSDDRIVECRRIRLGQPLRDAMKHRQLSLHQLAELTAAIDPKGRGVNWRTIGFLTSQWASGRETTTYANARMLALALDVPLSTLFDLRFSAAFDAAPTSTQRRDGADTP